MTGWAPDGSAAFEERMRRNAEQARNEVSVEPEVHEEVRDVDPAPRYEPSPIVLGGAVEHDDGSWAFPPPPTTDVDAMARWWATLKIADHVLENIAAADMTGRDLVKYEDEFREWTTNKPALSKRYERKHPEEFAQYQAEFIKRKAIVNAVLYQQGLIPRTALRDAARVGAFWLQALDLDQDSRTKAYRTVFQLSDGTVATAGDISQKYRLLEIQSAFFGKEKFHRPEY